MSHARAAALMVAAALMWSTAGVVVRMLERTPSFEVAFWRSFFAALAMAAMLAFIHRRRLLRVVRDAGWPGVLSGAMFATMFTCFMLAVTRTTVANALVVNSLFPVFAGVLGTVVLGTRLPLYTWIAILVAVSGMVFMFASGLGAGLVGTLIAFVVPIAAAVNVVTLKRWGRKVDFAPAVMLGGLLSAAFTLPLALPFAASLHDLAWLAGLGLFQLAVPCMLLVIASRYLAAAEVALLTLLEAIMGPLWAWLGVGEVPGAATLTGGAIVLAAIAGNEAIALYGPARMRRLRTA